VTSRVPWPTRAFLSIEETSVLLGISRATLYRSVQRGDFPVPVVQLNGRLRVPRRAVERLMEGIAPAAPVSPATLDEHQADTFGEHVFVNVLSPWSSSVAP